mmetsp:Transcript_12465/g.19639  ORF Transcript_12465/g.19639 Transcript_12465/m.19639 type:complete len:113 (-) Transcript_12465:602-940(-)
MLNFPTCKYYNCGYSINHSNPEEIMTTPEFLNPKQAQILLICASSFLHHEDHNQHSKQNWYPPALVPCNRESFPIFTLSSCQPMLGPSFALQQQFPQQQLPTNRPPPSIVAC